MDYFIKIFIELLVELVVMISKILEVEDIFKKIIGLVGSMKMLVE